MDSHSLLLTSGFLLGIGGSLHCVGMCGPLVLAAARITGKHPHARRIAVLHQLGRITTYATLGLTAGSLGRSLTLLGWQRPLTIGMGLAILTSLILGSHLAPTSQLAKWIGRLNGQLQRNLKSNRLWTHFAVGLTHGLLPCGLVYVALGMAAASGHPIHGAGFMMAFGIGTLPLLLGLAHLPRTSFGSRLLTQRYWLTGLAFLAGTLLILRGLELGVPYLSPKFTENGIAACCQPNLGNPAPITGKKSQKPHTN